MWDRGVTDPLPLRRAELRSFAEARIQRRAHYDALTGLPNRRLFGRRVAAAIGDELLRRRSFALLCIDLDGFSSINDALGHAAGDELLRRLAPRLTRSIGPEDTLCRTEADRFLLLLADSVSPWDACRAASRLMVAIARPILVAGRSLVVPSSVGISLFPEHGSEESLLAARAAHALSEAKREGRASIRVFGERAALRASA